MEGSLRSHWVSYDQFNIAGEKCWSEVRRMSWFPEDKGGWITFQVQPLSCKPCPIMASWRDPWSSRGETWLRLKRKVLKPRRCDRKTIRLNSLATLAWNGPRTWHMMVSGESCSVWIIETFHVVMVWLSVSNKRFNPKYSGSYYYPNEGPISPKTRLPINQW